MGPPFYFSKIFLIPTCSRPSHIKFRKHALHPAIPTDAFFLFPPSTQGYKSQICTFGSYHFHLSVRMNSFGGIRQEKHLYILQ